MMDYRYRARDDPAGAVKQRESTVWSEYLRHARELDRRFSNGATPIEDRLRSFTEARGLIFGAFGEASEDVHALVSIAATKIADDKWQLYGARTAFEMRAFVINRLRHRLAKLPYVNVPRALVRARPQRTTTVQPTNPWLHDELYALQGAPQAA